MRYGKDEYVAVGVQHLALNVDQVVEPSTIEEAFSGDLAT